MWLLRESHVTAWLLRGSHATAWLKRKEEEERDTAAVQEPGGGGNEGTVVAEAPAEVETPIALAPQDLPIIIDIGIPPSVLHYIETFSVLRDVEPPSDASTHDRITVASSPTLSISTVSDLTPTELDGDEHIPTRHETFYIEDGNVEIVCGHTIFRVHSSVVSFSSLNLRDALSKSTLLRAPTPEGCPRVVFTDSAEDFAVLLKMIYTPGYVPPFDATSVN